MLDTMASPSELNDERIERAVLGSRIAIWDWDMTEDKIHWLGHSYRSLGYISLDSIPQNADNFFSSLIHEDFELALKQAIDTHFKDNKELALPLRIRKADGTPLWVMAKAQAQFDQNRTPIRLSGSFTDIDNLKQAEDRLMRSNHDLQQFASVAAHDLQQPLRAISGLLDIVYNKESLSENGKYMVSKALQSAEDMSYLVNDLMSYSKLETEELKKKPVNLNKIINQASRHILHIIEEKEAEIEIDEMPDIICDEYKLQRVFINLIDNALKYCNNETVPHIKFTCERDKDFWYIQIQDNGIGIEEKNLDKIFHMFNRLHLKDEYEGTGIGLSICWKIIHLHDGEIWATSEFGRGTTFHLTLPA
ncbi:MAG: PAS domain-containing protein [Micavibrio sp.]|nr:PAS domain-containing protein [Micavibrio sp.]